MSADLDRLTDLAKAQQWPVDMAQWAEISSPLEKLDDGIEKGSKNEIITSPTVSPSLNGAKDARASLGRRIRESASLAFKNFDLLTGPDFTRVYPIDVNIQ